MTRLLTVAAVVLGTMFVGVSSCSTMPTARETCGNGIDDDNNGLIDCADPDCKGQTACFFDGGFFGSCAKCGQTCSRQDACLQTSYFNDVPLPRCEPDSKKCSALSPNVQVNVILETARWGTEISRVRSIVTRFIRKAEADGGVITCSTIEAAAPGRNAADSQQLEMSGRFSYLGIDSRTINGSGSIPIRLINVTTGGDYLIWMEMWAGPPDGVTKFPTGRRLGFECFDGPSIGQAWTPVVELDNCTAPGVDAGVGAMCRNYSVNALNGPQP